MRTLELPPAAPQLMTATRSMGYSLESALADIIDNSITAGSERVDILYLPGTAGGEAFIAILDDGCGMAGEELTAAMRYGSCNPDAVREQGDLGRFGLGLKTASLSQCRRMTVVTRQGPAVEGRRWDLDYVRGVGTWALQVLEPDDLHDIPGMDALMRLESGTLVVWQQLDRLGDEAAAAGRVLGDRMANEVREHLALVFHRYLSGEPGLGHLRLFMNNVRVDPRDPFMTSKSQRTMAPETLIVRGEKITVQTFLLPHPFRLSAQELSELGGDDGIRARQGFYVYRNRRLLVGGDWFRMARKDDLTKLARIMVDIPNSLDHLWTLDIRKSMAIPPEEVKTALRSIVRKLGDGSRHTYAFRGKRETDDRVVHVWNRLKTSSGGCVYEINRDHPYLAGLRDAHPEACRHFEAFIRQIECGLPLNQLYQDMAERDVRLENDSALSAAELCRMMEDILAGVLPAQRGPMLETLIAAEPFRSCAADIRRALEHGTGRQH